MRVPLLHMLSLVCLQKEKDANESLIGVLRTVMKASLRGLFKAYGEVLDVVAHKNLRMRGQAFVSFENADIARKAMTEVQRFPLYGKPMVRLSSFSPLHSD